MKEQSIIYRLITLLVLASFISCSKDEMQAELSLEGEWNVIEITSSYGEFRENGFNPSEVISDTGALGTFDFSPDTVIYNFTRNDTTFTGHGPWYLDLDKVREGFNRVNTFTLTIEDDFIFELKFGDGTSDSEKNAESLQLTEVFPTHGVSVAIELMLQKK